MTRTHATIDPRRLFVAAALAAAAWGPALAQDVEKAPPAPGRDAAAEDGDLAAETAYLKAYFAEKELKDFARAMKEYEQVTSTRGASRDLIARAWMGFQRCARANGSVALADSTLGKIEKEFADVKDVATEAARLRSTTPAAAGAWRIRMVRDVWWPTLITGGFVLRHDAAGGTWTGGMIFDQLGYSGVLPIEKIAIEGTRLHMTVPAAGGGYEFDGDLRGDDIEGRVRWRDPEGRAFEEPFRAERPVVRRFDAGVRSGAFPTAEDPAAVGVDPLALDLLLVLAQDADSDALVVVKDGKLVCDRSFGRRREPIDIGTVTEGIASLAVPFLIAEGKVASLDAPMAAHLPEWAGDRRSRITLRHVLTHQSGLDVRYGTALERRPKAFAYALATPASHDPGTFVEESDIAFETLGGFVERAAGEHLDTYLAKRLFAPLGIVSARWTDDGDRIERTSSGLALDAADLAKLGWMLCEGGRWRDREVVPGTWVKSMQAIADPLSRRVGLAWRLRPDFARSKFVQTPESRRASAAAGFVAADKLAPLDGEEFPTELAYWKALRERIRLPDDVWKTMPDSEDGLVLPCDVVGPQAGFYLRGSRGQFLFIDPAHRLVVVRLVGHRAWLDDDSYAATRIRFRRFHEAVEALVRR